MKYLVMLFADSEIVEVEADSPRKAVIKELRRQGHVGEGEIIARCEGCEKLITENDKFTLEPGDNVYVCEKCGSTEGNE
jgi:uncharacterized protein with PIN domain